MDKNPTRFKDKMSQDEKPSWELHGFEIFNVFRLFHAKFFFLFLSLFCCLSQQQQQQCFSISRFMKEQGEDSHCPKTTVAVVKEMCEQKIWPNFFLQILFSFFSPVSSSPEVPPNTSSHD